MLAPSRRPRPSELALNCCAGRMGLAERKVIPIDSHTVPVFGYNRAPMPGDAAIRAELLAFMLY